MPFGQKESCRNTSTFCSVCWEKFINSILEGILICLKKTIEATKWNDIGDSGPLGTTHCQRMYKQQILVYKHHWIPKGSYPKDPFVCPKEGISPINGTAERNHSTFLQMTSPNSSFYPLVLGRYPLFPWYIVSWRNWWAWHKETVENTIKCSFFPNLFIFSIFFSCSHYAAQKLTGISSPPDFPRLCHDAVVAPPPKSRKSPVAVGWPWYRHGCVDGYVIFVWLAAKLEIGDMNKSI